MAGRKKGGDSGGGSAWLNTYADMVTLLLAFFAVLLSMSTTDEAKFNAFIESFSNLPQEVIDEITGNAEEEQPGDTVSIQVEFDELYKQLSDYVEESGLEASIDIMKIDDIIYIRFDDAIFFLPNQYVLRPDSIPIINEIGNAINSYEENVRMINVLGFTATIEDETAVYHMLSAQRAGAVTTNFQVNSGIDPEKLVIMGYGNKFPIAPNDTEENMAKNRRVELIIVSEAADENVNIDEALQDFYDQNQYPAQGTENDAILPSTDSTTDSVVEDDVSGNADDTTEADDGIDDNTDTTDDSTTQGDDTVVEGDVVEDTTT